MNTIAKFTQKAALNRGQEPAQLSKTKTFSKTQWVAWTLLPLALPISVLAQAEGNKGRFEITPYAGMNTFGSKQNLEDSPVYGAHLGYYVTDNFAVELSAGLVGSNVDDVTLTSGREGRYRSPTDDVDLTFYNIDALYHFSSDSKWTPYLVAGAGGTHYKPAIADKDMATLNAGAGVKYAFNDNFALRFEVRDYLVGELFQESYHNVQTTLGLAFTLGSKKRAYQAEVANDPAPVSRPAPRPVVAAPKEEVVLSFEDIHFNFDQSELTPEARALLKDNLETLANNPKVRVRISGHTSGSGTEEYNNALSLRRANAIKSYLISEGVSPQRLTTIGYSENRPAEHESDTTDLNSSAAKANMRALFEITVE
jgi:OmpA-OmpF porin, OOP family